MSNAKSARSRPKRASASGGSPNRFPPALALAALGVVFGDIGTSPLYTLPTCLTTANVPPTLENVGGIISLIFWTLVIVVCVKYVTLMMRADHEGEGGILALLALASPPKLIGRLHGSRWLIPVVIVAGAMLLGDGMITPAISVVSAVEGLDIVTKSAHPFIVPISVGILLALFLIQSRGTQRVGTIFGPVMMLWFIAIGIVGARSIFAHPQILAAANPLLGLHFAFHHGIFGFLIFGAIVLCVTGAEALYADLSHFGRMPITWAWYCVVFPALILNYFGQGAVLMSGAKGVDAAPFFALSTGWMLLPMVILATLATVIASQSLISGAFTLAEQAIAMNLSPRFKVSHTSSSQEGQVYIPFINVLLAVVCILLVVSFRSSARLAAAYGLAVSCTMLGTTIAYYVVATTVFKWKKYWVVLAIAPFAILELTFVTSGLPKFLDGAWVPITIGALLSLISAVWLRGRRALHAAISADQMPLDNFVAKYGLKRAPNEKVVLLTGDTRGVPFVEHHHWVPSFLDDKTVVLMTLSPARRPYIPDDERVEIERVAASLVIVHASFGYMEALSIERVLEACKAQGVDVCDDDVPFVYAIPTIADKRSKGMKRWERRLFSWLTRQSRPLVEDLEIPSDRRIGIGTEVAL